MIDNSIKSNKWYRNIIETGGQQSKINNRVRVDKQEENINKTKLLMKDWYNGLDMSNKTIYFDTTKTWPSSTIINGIEYYGINGIDIMDGVANSNSISITNGNTLTGFTITVWYDPYLPPMFIVSNSNWLLDKWNITSNYMYITNLSARGNFPQDSIPGHPEIWTLSDAWIYI